MIFTFDALVPLVPASKLLAFRGGDVDVVGTVHYGGDHTLIGREEETRTQSLRQHNVSTYSFKHLTSQLVFYQDSSSTLSFPSMHCGLQRRR